MTSREFEFDAVQGNASLAMFSLAPSSGTVRLAGTKLQAGSMAALFRAEWLAAAAGVVPFIRLDNGERGLIQVGAARERITRPNVPEGVRALYLATHNSVRMAQVFAKDANLKSDAEHVSLLTSAPIGVLPVVAISLTVLGLAATVATAWYALKSTQKVVDTGAEYLARMSAIDKATIVASALIAAGKDIPPELYEVFKGEAKKEQFNSVAPWAVVGLGAAAFGIWGARELFGSGGRRAS